MFEKGDKVSWTHRDYGIISGTVLKVYETTFGSAVKDTALQIRLFEKHKGRTTTTIRACNCSLLQKKIPIVEKPNKFARRKCTICDEPAKTRIFSKESSCIDEYYCTKCYKITRALLPFRGEKGCGV